MKRNLPAVILVSAAAAAALFHWGGELRDWGRSRGFMKRTVNDVLRQHGPAARQKFAPGAERFGIQWPPEQLTLLAFKREKVLEVWAGNDGGRMHKLGAYTILAASGNLGPKRMEGDRQVPEGFYRLSSLNPNSRYHLSIKVDYPNEEDVQHSAVAKDHMGGDIFVHGNSVSIGCIAIGDKAIEELFCLVAWSKRRDIIIAPVDFRSGARVSETDPWVGDLYQRMGHRLENFK